MLTHNALLTSTLPPLKLLYIPHSPGPLISSTLSHSTRCISLSTSHFDRILSYQFHLNSICGYALPPLHPGRPLSEGFVCLQSNGPVNLSRGAAARAGEQTSKVVCPLVIGPDEPARHTRGCVFWAVSAPEIGGLAVSRSKQRTKDDGNDRHRENVYSFHDTRAVVVRWTYIRIYI